MCLEVFHPEQPIVIRYENEVLQFQGDQQIEASYTLLIQNGGSAPLFELHCLYPRALYWKDPQSGEWCLNGLGLSDAPINLKDGHFDPQTNIYTVAQPDPNRPQFNRTAIEGEWLPGTAFIDPDVNLPPDGIALLHRAELCFFRIRFPHDTPIQPGESRWIVLETEVSGIGQRLSKTVLNADIVVHQFASPYDVRRTAEEKLETCERTAEKTGDWIAKLCRQVREELGIITPRRVDLEYYELVVFPGPHSERVLIDWNAERDLRMRSNCPRVEDSGSRMGQLRCEWKTGSILKPDGYPWKHEGFFLHLTFACKPRKGSS